MVCRRTQPNRAVWVSPNGSYSPCESAVRSASVARPSVVDCVEFHAVVYLVW